MPQTATIYLLRVEDLDSLSTDLGSSERKRKGLLFFLKRSPIEFFKKLDNIAIETMRYRWSGLAFAALAVFSKERLGVDWDNLQYSSIANDFSRNLEAGVYIFSLTDKKIQKLNVERGFYTQHDLDEFAVEFAGEKPANPDIMKDAVTLLNKAVSKLSEETTLLLSIV